MRCALNVVRNCATFSVEWVKVEVNMAESSNLRPTSSGRMIQAGSPDSFSKRRSASFGHSPTRDSTSAGTGSASSSPRLSGVK